MEFMTCATGEAVAVHHREDDHYVSFPSLPTECAVNGAGAFNDVSRCPKIGILVIRLEIKFFAFFIRTIIALILNLYLQRPL